jgi:hypothetical protein
MTEVRLIESLQTFIASTDKLIQSGNEIVKAKGIQEFVRTEMGTLLTLLFSYKDLYSSALCFTETQFLAVLQQTLQALRNKSTGSEVVVVSSEDLEEKVEEFFRAEKSWEDFLLALDILLEDSDCENRLELEEKIPEMGLESLSDRNENEGYRCMPVKEVVGGWKWTWGIFLRHFS